MNDDLISVIVPVYNIKMHLNKCVDSIINQTYQNLEIILVDDGSTDGSGNVCDEYSLKDERIIVIHKEKNGLVSARRTGLSAAHGKYIGMIDGSDWVDPEMYYDMLEDFKRTSADFIEGGFSVEGQYEVNCNYDKREYELREKTRKSIVEDWLMHGENFSDNHILRSTIWGKLYKSDLIKTNYCNIPLTMSTGEDWLFFLYILNASNKVYVSHNCYYHHNRKGDSLTANISAAYISKISHLNAEVYSVINNLYPYIDRTILDEWFLNRYHDLDKLIEKKNGLESIKYVPESMDGLLDKRIIIYGAGRVGRDVYKCISLYQRCTIVAWVDKNYQEYDYPFCEIKPPKTIKTLDYDLVLIAVLNKKTIESIKQELIECGVPRKKILCDFYKSISDHISVKKSGYNVVNILGGLGNQMFQYAFYRALESKNAATRGFVGGFKGYKRPFVLTDIFPNLKLNIDLNDDYHSYAYANTCHTLYVEKGPAEYDSSVFGMRDVSFTGYWQTEKYFKDIEETIREDFEFSVQDKELSDYSSKVKKNAHSVSVHIRRGDYLESPDIYCGICSIDYYKRAIKYINNRIDNPTYYFFSDDMKWVENNFSDVQKAVFVSKQSFSNYHDWYDMYLMSCCDHNIIANSSFSWWGAWLNSNPNKIVIAPQNWQNGVESPDICPSDWIRM